MWHPSTHLVGHSNHETAEDKHYLSDIYLNIDASDLIGILYKGLGMCCMSG